MKKGSDKKKLAKGRAASRDPYAKARVLTSQSRALAAAGFKEANHYHARDVYQFTSTPMHTISFEEAEDLAESICINYFTERVEGDGESEGVEWLVRLITGIAAYEDHEYRQICAERAIREIFKHANTGRRKVADFVQGIHDLAERGAL